MTDPPERYSRWRHPDEKHTFYVERADRGENAYVYLTRRNKNGYEVGGYRIHRRDWPGEWKLWRNA